MEWAAEGCGGAESGAWQAGGGAAQRREQLPIRGVG